MADQNLSMDVVIRGKDELSINLSKVEASISSFVNSASAKLSSLNTNGLTKQQEAIEVNFKNLQSSIIRSVGAVSAAIEGARLVAFPISEASSFQKEMLNVQRTTQFTDASIVKLGREFQHLSTEIPVSAHELAEIASVAGRLGIGHEGIEGLKNFTATVARFAADTGVGVEQAAIAFGKLQTIFGVTIDKTENLSAALVTAAHTTKVLPTQLLDSVQKLGSAGGILNSDQSITLAATGISLGQTPETTATGFIRIFAEMESKAAQFAEFMGTSTDQWVATVRKDGVGALQEVLAKLNTLRGSSRSQVITDLLSQGGRQLSLVNKLLEDQEKGVNSNLVKSLATVQRASAEGIAALREQAITLRGLSAQTQLLKNSFTALGIEIGEQAVPKLTEFVTKLKEVVNGEGIRHFFFELAEEVGAVGNTLTGVFNGGLSDVHANITNLVKLLTAFASVKLAQAVFGWAQSIGAFSKAAAGLNSIGGTLQKSVDIALNPAKAWNDATTAVRGYIAAVSGVTGAEAAQAAALAANQKLADARSREVLARKALKATPTDDPTRATKANVVAAAAAETVRAQQEATAANEKYAKSLEGATTKERQRIAATEARVAAEKAAAAAAEAQIALGNTRADQAKQEAEVKRLAAEQEAKVNAELAKGIQLEQEKLDKIRQQVAAAEQAASAVTQTGANTRTFLTSLKDKETKAKFDVADAALRVQPKITQTQNEFTTKTKTTNSAIRLEEGDKLATDLAALEQKKADKIAAITAKTDEGRRTAEARITAQIAKEVEARIALSTKEVARRIAESEKLLQVELEASVQRINAERVEAEARLANIQREIADIERAEGLKSDARINARKKAFLESRRLDVEQQLAEATTRAAPAETQAVKTALSTRAAQEANLARSEANKLIKDLAILDQRRLADISKITATEESERKAAEAAITADFQRQVEARTELARAQSASRIQGAQAERAISLQTALEDIGKEKAKLEARLTVIKNMITQRTAAEEKALQELEALRGKEAELDKATQEKIVAAHKEASERVIAIKAEEARILQSLTARTAEQEAAALTLGTAAATRQGEAAAAAAAVSGGRIASAFVLMGRVVAGVGKAFSFLGSLFLKGFSFFFLLDIVAVFLDMIGVLKPLTDLVFKLGNAFGFVNSEADKTARRQRAAREELKRQFEDDAALRTEAAKDRASAPTITNAAKQTINKTGPIDRGTLVDSASSLFESIGKQQAGADAAETEINNLEKFNDQRKEALDKATAQLKVANADYAAATEERKRLNKDLADAQAAPVSPAFGPNRFTQVTAAQTAVDKILPGVDARIKEAEEVRARLEREIAALKKDIATGGEESKTALEGERGKAIETLKTETDALLGLVTTNTAPLVARARELAEANKEFERLRKPAGEAQADTNALRGVNVLAPTIGEASRKSAEEAQNALSTSQEVIDSQRKALDTKISALRKGLEDERDSRLKEADKAVDEIEKQRLLRETVLIDAMLKNIAEPERLKALDNAIKAREAQAAATGQPAFSNTTAIQGTITINKKDEEFDKETRLKLQTRRLANDEEFRVAKAQADRLLEVDRQRIQQGLLTEAEGLQRRNFIVKREVDAEIATKQRDLAAAAADVKKPIDETQRLRAEQDVIRLTHDLEILEQKRKQVGEDFLFDVQALGKKMEDELLNLQSEFFTSQGNELEAATASIKSKYRQTLEEISSLLSSDNPFLREFGQAKFEIVVKLINKEIVEAQIRDLENLASRVSEGVGLDQQRFQLEAEAGLRTTVSAQEAATQARKEYADVLEKRVIPDLEELLKNSSGLEKVKLTLEIEGFKNQLTEARNAVSDTAREINESFLSAFENVFTSVGDRSKKFSDVLRDSFLGIVRDINRVAARALIESLTGDLFKGPNSIGARLGGILNENKDKKETSVAKVAGKDIPKETLEGNMKLLGDNVGLNTSALAGLQKSVEVLSPAIDRLAQVISGANLNAKQTKDFAGGIDPFAQGKSGAPVPVVVVGKSDIAGVPAAITPNGSTNIASGPVTKEKVIQYSNAVGIDPAVSLAIWAQESGSGANTSTSNKGAVGGFQVTPPAFSDVKKQFPDQFSPTDQLSDPLVNMKAGILYIKRLDNEFKDINQDFAAYFSGPGSVRAAIEKGRAGGIPQPGDLGGQDTLNKKTTASYAEDVQRKFLALKDQGIGPAIASTKEATADVSKLGSSSTMAADALTKFGEGLNLAQINAPVTKKDTGATGTWSGGATGTWEEPVSAPFTVASAQGFGPNVTPGANTPALNLAGSITQGLQPLADAAQQTTIQFTPLVAAAEAVGRGLNSLTQTVVTAAQKLEPLPVSEIPPTQIIPTIDVTKGTVSNPVAVTVVSDLITGQGGSGIGGGPGGGGPATSGTTTPATNGTSGLVDTRTLGQQIGDVFGQLGPAIGASLGAKAGPIGSILGSAIGKILTDPKTLGKIGTYADQFGDWLSSALKGIFSSSGSGGGSGGLGSILSSVSNFGSSFTDTVSGIFSSGSSIFSTISSFGSSLSSIFGSIFSSIGTLFSGGVGAAAGGFSLEGLLTSALTLFALKDGGEVSEHDIRAASRFADGGAPTGVSNGRIYGPGTGTSDSILGMVGQTPIRVANGEYIMPEKITKQWYPVFQKIRDGSIRVQDFVSNRMVPAVQQHALGVQRFAEGGLVNVDISGIAPGGRVDTSSIQTAAPAASPNMSQKVNVYNVLDPNLLEDYYSSARGEKHFVNMITKNKSTIRQVLG